MTELRGFIGVRSGSTLRWWVPAQMRSRWRGRGGRCLRQATPEECATAAVAEAKWRLMPWTRVAQLARAKAPPQEAQLPKVPGVTWSTSRRKWRAQVKHAGKSRHLGYFDNHADAVAARLHAKEDAVAV